MRSNKSRKKSVQSQKVPLYRLYLFAFQSFKFNILQFSIVQRCDQAPLSFKDSPRVMRFRD